MAVYFQGKEAGGGGKSHTKPGPEQSPFCIETGSLAGNAVEMVGRPFRPGSTRYLDLSVTRAH
jgi:hypothetical protein